jgi:hypothetical protein
MTFAFPQQSFGMTIFREKKKNASVKNCNFSDKTPYSLLKVNRLHSVISQKIEIFITTAMKTSNPTNRSGCTAITSCFSILGTKVYIKGPHFGSP